MRRGALVLVLAAAVAAVPSASARARDCVPRGARVLARDRVLRVYSLGVAPGESIRACDAATGASMTFLGRASSVHVRLRSLRDYRLAGTIVGYIETLRGIDSGASALVVVDVAARRILRRVDAGHYVDAGIIFREGVSDTLLTRHGSLAWITARGGGITTPLVVVHVAARTGPPRVLDEGSDIGEQSLELAGSTLSWSHGGSRRSAPMP